MIVVCILYLLNLIGNLDFAIVAKFLLMRHVMKLYFSLCLINHSVWIVSQI